VKPGMATLFLLSYPVIGLGAGFGLGADLRPSSQSVVDTGPKVSGAVDETGEFTLGGTRFELKERVSGEDVVGRAHMDEDRVEIETGRSVSDLYSTCVHEHWGHIESGYVHEGGDSASDDEWVDEMEEQVVSETCLKLLYRVDGGKA